MLKKKSCSLFNPTVKVAVIKLPLGQKPPFIVGHWISFLVFIYSMFGYISQLKFWQDEVASLVQMPLSCFLLQCYYPFLPSWVPVKYRQKYYQCYNKNNNAECVNYHQILNNMLLSVYIVFYLYMAMAIQSLNNIMSLWHDANKIKVSILRAYICTVL